eukprot:5668578-Amphidinium_carterae.1
MYFAEKGEFLFMCLMCTFLGCLTSKGERSTSSLSESVSNTINILHKAHTALDGGEDALTRTLVEAARLEW